LAISVSVNLDHGFHPDIQSAMPQSPDPVSIIICREALFIKRRTGLLKNSAFSDILKNKADAACHR
jgi:hypothetical protein